MSLAEVRAEHLRLAILRLLADEDGDYPVNESILFDAVEQLALGATRDQIRAEITWLAQAGLVIKEEVLDLYVATITERGIQVARGKVSYSGVKRPKRRG